MSLLLSSSPLSFVPLAQCRVSTSASFSPLSNSLPLSMQRQWNMEYNANQALSLYIHLPPSLPFAHTDTHTHTHTQDRQPCLTSVRSRNKETKLCLSCASLFLVLCLFLSLFFYSFCVSISSQMRQSTVMEL